MLDTPLHFLVQGAFGLWPRLQAGPICFHRLQHCQQSQDGVLCLPSQHLVVGRHSIRLHNLPQVCWLGRSICKKSFPGTALSPIFFLLFFLSALFLPYLFLRGFSNPAAAPTTPTFTPLPLVRALPTLSAILAAPALQISTRLHRALPPATGNALYMFFFFFFFWLSAPWLFLVLLDLRSTPSKPSLFFFFLGLCYGSYWHQLCLDPLHTHQQCCDLDLHDVHRQHCARCCLHTHQRSSELCELL